MKPTIEQVARDAAPVLAELIRKNADRRDFLRQSDSPRVVPGANLDEQAAS